MNFAMIFWIFLIFFILSIFRLKWKNHINDLIFQLSNTGCCIELVLFHWGVWQQKFLLQPTPLFCEGQVCNLDELKIKVFLTKCGVYQWSLSNWCECSVVFLAVSCVWKEQHGVWRERCYWLHLLLFPFGSFVTVIQTCTQEQLVWCCVHFALHCTCKTPCCCMEVPNHELYKTSLLQRPFLRHFKHFFHPDRTSPSKWTSVTSPKSAQNHVHESLSSDFNFSFFT